MDDDHPNILRGPTISLDVPQVTIGQFLFDRLKRHNPYDVLMCEAETGVTITPLEFLSLSIKVAVGLKEAGLEPGDVVCLMGKAGIRVYATATGTLFQGGTVHPLDHNLPPEIFQEILKTTKPKFIFCDPEIVQGVSDILSRVNATGCVILFNSDVTGESTHQVFENFTRTPVNFREFCPVASGNPEESVAFLICSSGTMGVPKPVMITDKNLVYQATVWSVLGSFNKIMSCPSITFSYFFWVSGVLLYLMAISMNFEMTIVQKLEATHVLSVIDRQKVSLQSPVWGMFSPALVRYLTFHPDFQTYNVSSLMFMITGGSSLPKILANKIKEYWGGHLACRQSYGITEISGAATASGMDDDILSVGRLLPGFQMKIVSMSDGSILGPGQEGEIFLKSPSVMKGYMGNQETTGEVLKGGWYKTGDVGRYSDSGLIYIQGRVKDFFQFNNMLISPTEIEEVILGIPGVADVGVVGIKKNEDNFLPLALVVKTKGSNVTEEAVFKCVNDNLDEHKQLRGGVYFVNFIPRTSSGKMKRADLLHLAKSLYLEK